MSNRKLSTGSVRKVAGFDWGILQFVESLFGDIQLPEREKAVAIICTNYSSFSKIFLILII